VVHDQWFLDLDVFHKGFARTRDEDGWTHVDLRGRPAYSRRFAAVEPFYNGQARVERLDGGLEVIDESGHALQELRAGTETDLQRLSGLMVGFWKTQVVRAAAKLRIIDYLPGAEEDVAKRASLSPDSTRRILRALWELGVVERHERTWTPTPMGGLLCSDSPSAMADAAKHWGTEHYAAWAELAESLATGEPGFDRVYGQPFFSWLASKPRQLHRYHRAMRGYAVHDYEQLHEFLPLDGVSHVIDAGGGSGAIVANLVANRPDLSGTLLDLPEVIESPVMADRSAQGVRRIGADIFEPWPCKADLVVLARVLHDWDDDHARVILGRAREALEPGGRIALVEFVLTEEGPKGSLLDLNMLAICGARERTAKEWKSLVRSAGLDVHRTTTLPRYGALLVLTPRGGTDA
jgi:trans-aconitate methyltransferase